MEPISSFDRALELDNLVQPPPPKKKRGRPPKNGHTPQPRSNGYKRKHSVSDEDSNLEDEMEDDGVKEEDDLSSKGDSEYTPNGERTRRRKKINYNIKNLMQTEFSKSIVSGKRKRVPKVFKDFEMPTQTAGPLKASSHIGYERDLFAGLVPDPSSRIASLDERVFLCKVDELHAIKEGSGGFQLFISSMTDQKTVALFETISKRYNFPPDSDDVLQLAQMLRHVWNVMSDSYRRSFEEKARRLRLESMLNDPSVSMPPNEFKYMESKNQKKPKLPKNACKANCCETAGVWKTFQDVANHLLSNHNSSHFYACHFCMNMYHSQKDLLDHRNCQPFSDMMLSRMLDATSSMAFSAAALFLCCTECGLWLPLKSEYVGDRFTKAWTFLTTILKYHSCASMTPVVVYMYDLPQGDGTERLLLEYMPSHLLTNIPYSCKDCNIDEFETFDALELHFKTNHRDQCYVCSHCNGVFGTEAMYKVHCVSVTGDTMLFADYLHNTATAYPPHYKIQPPTIGLKRSSHKIAVGGHTILPASNPNAIVYAETTTPDPDRKARNAIHRLPAEIEDENSNKNIRTDTGLESYDYSFSFESPELMEMKETLMKSLKTQLQSNDDDIASCHMDDIPKIGQYFGFDENGEERKLNTVGMDDNTFMQSFVRKFKKITSLPMNACVEMISGSILNRKYLYCDDCKTIYSDDNRPCQGCDPEKTTCLFNPSLPSNSTITCPKGCEGDFCSISSLRAHFVKTHLTFIKHIPIPVKASNPSSIVELSKTLKEDDDRTYVAIKTDYALSMPSGALVLKPYVPLKNKPVLPPPRSMLRAVPSVPVRTRQLNSKGDMSFKSIVPTLPSKEFGQANTIAPFKVSMYKGMENMSCQFCDFSCLSRKKMCEHLRTAHTHICRGCGIAYSMLKKMEIHNETSCHQQFMNKPVGHLRGNCPECNVQYSLPHLYNHMFECHVDRISYGSLSGKLYRHPTMIGYDPNVMEATNGNNVVQRYKVYTPPAKPQYTCYLCGYESTTKVLLLHHLLNHQEKWTSCPFCNVDVSSHDDFYNHLKEVHVKQVLGTDKYCCTFCGLKVDETQINHVLYECTCTAMCALCGNQQGQSSHGFKSHWNNTHFGTFTRFECSDCHQGFPTIQMCKYHACKAGSTYECHCGTISLSLQAFESHFERHMNGMKCVFCKLSFTRYRELKEHTHKHATVRSRNLTSRKILVKEEKLLCGDLTPLEKQMIADELEANDASSKGAIVSKCVKNLITSVCKEMGENDDSARATPSTVIDEDDDEIECISVNKPIMSSDNSRTQSPFVHTSNTDDNNDDDDDELQVVGEFEKPVGTQSTTTHREKSYKCDKCSLSFMTIASLNNHVTQSHSNDAGGIIDEVFGVPLKGTFYLCRNCCAVFEDHNMYTTHMRAHGQSGSISCALCSAISYNSNLHQQHCNAHKINSKLFYGCGTCRQMFKSDYRYNYHLREVHRKPILFFCKVCGLTNADIANVYQHVANSAMCKNGCKTRNMRLEQAVGVFPANIVHFQPRNIEKFRHELSNGLISCYHPSDCAHRSFLAQLDTVITCRDCNYYISSASYSANEAIFHGKPVEISMSLEDEDCSNPFKREMMQPGSSILSQHYGARSINTSYNNNSRGGHQRIPPYTNGNYAIRTPPTGVRTPQTGIRTTPQTGIRTTPQTGIRTHPQTGVRTTPATTVRTTPSVTQLAPSSGLLRNFNSQLLHNNPNINKIQPRIPYLTREAPPVPTFNTTEVVTLNDDEPTPSEMPSLDSLPNILRRHGAIKEHLDKDICTVCNSEMKTEQEKRLHQLHNSDDMWFCLECANPYKTETDAVKHYYSTHVAKGEVRPLRYDLKCPFETCAASVGFASLLAYKQHINRTHVADAPHLSLCNLRFCNQEVMEKHNCDHEEFETKNGFEGQCCALCGVSNQWNVQSETGINVAHIAVHGLLRYTMCRDCFKCFPKDVSNEKVVSHFKNVHCSIVDRSMTCNMCKRVVNADEMADHIKSKHLVFGYKSKTAGQLVVQTGGLTKQFLGLMKPNDEFDY